MKRPLLLVLAFLLLLPISCATASSDPTYKDRLYTPTQISRIDGNYFIVDCWNHRIIYNDDLNAPIKDWKTLDDDIAGPHSIASDGQVYIAEDTGRHRLFVYKKTGDEFSRVQILDNMGNRPHKTIYDNVTERFYVMSSMTQELLVLKDNNGTVELENKIPLPFLNGLYTRSFSIIDGQMYFVSGAQKITVADYNESGITVVKQYDVPEKYASMNDIEKIGDYFYISSTPQALIRLKDLSNFNGSVDLMDDLGLKGTPYFISKIENTIFVPQITEYSGIKSFVLIKDSIKNIKTIDDSGEANDAVKKRSLEFPG